MADRALVRRDPPALLAVLVPAVLVRVALVDRDRVALPVAPVVLPAEVLVVPVAVLVVPVAVLVPVGDVAPRAVADVVVAVVRMISSRR